MIHIFDVDYTIIKKPSGLYFILEALREKVIKISQIYRLPFEWLKYKMGRASVDFIDDAAKYFAGLDQKTIERIAENCFNDKMKFVIYDEANSLIKNLLAKGDIVIFATSSFYTLIKPLEIFLGINDSIASPLEFKDGKLTGKIIGGSVFGERKKTAVEKWLCEKGFSANDVCFYTDSFTDLPLLEICGKPIAVNPDKFLLREAKKRGWEIKYFDKLIKI